MTAEVLVAVHVRVTEGHIAKGRPCRPADCPVWHGIADALTAMGCEHLVPTLSVGAGFFGLAGLRLPLPAVADQAAYLYDCGHRISPFSFELAVPARLLAEVTRG